MANLRTREGTAAKLYLQHVQNVKKEKAKIDNAAPRLPVGAYIKDARIYADLARLKTIDKENQRLLQLINIVYRSKGRVDCQLEKYKRQKTNFNDQAELRKKEQNKIMKFLEKLDPKFVKSQYSQEITMKDWKKILKVMRFGAKYPEFYDKKPSSLTSWSPCPKNLVSDPANHHV